MSLSTMHVTRGNSPYIVRYMLRYLDKYLIFSKAHLNDATWVGGWMVWILLILLPSQEIRGILAM
jgi:hypothetical protein